MATPGRVLFVSSVAAVVAALAAAGRALPVGESCSCALVDRGTVGQCLTFRPASVGASSGRCVGKNCEASFGCVDESVATHVCQSRAVKAVAVCDGGASAAPGETCDCTMQATSETTLVPSQAVSARTGTASTNANCKPATVSIHKVLQASGGKMELPDGRVLSASVKSVGGCKPRKDSQQTGTAKGEWTRLGQAPDGPSCTLKKTGDGEMYAGFQALLVRVDGGKMVPSMTFEDVDATTKKASEAKDGWRETMTALGRVDGAIVRPTLSTTKEALTGVFAYHMQGKSLKEVGWGKVPNMALDGVSYASWSRVENMKDHNAHLARGAARFSEPIDELLVVYALSQADKRKDATTAAFVSAVTVGC